VDFLTILNPQEWAALVVIIGALIVWVKQIRKFLASVWKKTLGSRAAQLNRIEQELISNGGTSIRDALKRIETRLNEIDAFQRASLNVHDVAIIRFDVNGKVVNINREFQRLTTASLVETRGDGWINVIHPEVRDSVLNKWYHAVKDQREFHEDVWFRRGDKDEFWAHVNVYREMDGAGHIRGYLGVVVPIMEDYCPYRAKCEAHAKLGLNDED